MGQQQGPREGSLPNADGGATNADRSEAPEEVLDKIHRESKEKAHAMVAMKDANEQLSGQVQESRMLLVRAHKEHEQIQKLADENAKLLVTVKEEKGECCDGIDTYVLLLMWLFVVDQMEELAWKIKW